MMRKLAICAVLLMLVVLTGVSAAQSTEVPAGLLRNPGFDEPHLEGPEGQVAEGWSAWYVGTLRPDYFLVPEEQERSVSGFGQAYNTIFGAYDAGIYQSVYDLAPGVALTFSANVWVWSTQDDLNPDLSVNPGDVSVQVGIDTTGGIDPEATTIIWSEPVEAYDEFITVSVTAAPTNDIATVFVRTVVGDARFITEVYIDDALLVVAGDDPEATPEAVDVEATAEAVPTEDAPVAEVTEEPLLPTEEAPVEATAEATEETAAVATEEPTVEATQETVVEATELPVEPTATLVPPTETPAPTAVIIVPPTEEPTAAPTEIPAEPTVSPFLSTIQYTVQSGDSFDLIARVYGSSVDAIKAANGIGPDDNLIYPGDVLVVPVPIPAISPETAEEPTAEPTAIPTEEPTIAPTDIPTEAPTSAPVETVVQPATYTVQRGDTLMDIASRFGTDVFELGRLNNIINYNLIRVGQVLVLPLREVETTPEAPVEPTATPVPVVYHFVQFGDSVYRIAARYGVTAQAIIEANGIENPNRIYYGQRLIIPQ